MGKRTRAAAALALANGTGTSSLSNFLLKGSEEKDNDIFKNSKGPTIAYTQPIVKPTKPSKKSIPSIPTPTLPIEPEEEEEEVPNDADLSEADSNESFADLGLELDSDEDDGVEEAYAATMVANRLKLLAEGNKASIVTGKGVSGKKRKALNQGSSDESGSDSDDEEDEQEIEDSDEEEELDIDNLMHESLLPKVIYKQVKATPSQIKKEKLVKARIESTETPEERDSRTIFLGNVPVGCSTSVPMKKALIRHILTSPTLLSLLPSNCPPIKATSIRFRSLAFASTVFGRKPDAAVDGEGNVIEPGGRGRKRAKEWRENEGTDERGVRGGFRAKEVEKKEEKKEDKKGGGAMNDGQKRRIAFIRGELNEGKKICNAYLVVDFLPKSFITLSMKELISLIIQSTDGSIFESFTLRADSVRPKSSASTIAASNLTSKPTKTEMNSSLPILNPGVSYIVPVIEARRTIFMGGLDFAESEENVRVATELILVREKGEVGVEGSYVERVRIVRDASTGLGKGFGYVLLRDSSCVDELLALPEGQPLKVSKRKVRLERCKTGVAAARAKASALAKDVKAATSSTNSKNPNLIKSGLNNPLYPADPDSRPRMSNKKTSASESAQQVKIAEALAKLNKGERKEIKQIDPERLMRRANKKKNKVLGERFERKQANADKAGGILGRESKAAERKRKEIKRVRSTLKGGKRYTGAPKK